MLFDSTEQHALFPDGSRFSKLISEVTNLHEDSSRRVQVAKELAHYIQTPSSYEVCYRRVQYYEHLSPFLEMLL